MSIVSSYFSSSRPRRSSSSSSSAGFIDVNSIMDTLSSILAGLALRFVIDRIGGNENKLTGTLVGLWEGVVLQHFMTKAKKRSRSSRSRSTSTSRSSSSRSAQPPYEAYLAFCVRLFVDYMLTESLMRVLLIALWTGLGVILADITPTIWADVGMRRFWRRFRRDMYYMTRSLPSISLPWSDNRSYSDSVYSSRPIGTRTTTVRFSPSGAPSEVSVITSTTQPPPLIQSFSSRFVPRSSRRPVPGAFPGDTISEAGTEVTATPSSTSVGLRSPYSDVSTESSGGGLFGSAFNAFSFLTGRPGRLASYPDTDNGADDDNRSTTSTITHSVGTSLHNPAEIPDEDDSDTETERERAALKKAKGKGKAKAYVEDVGDESTPTRPDIALPTPSESTILQHPSHLPLGSTTANPDYLHTGLAPDELPPPTAEMPLIPNSYGDDEWENISKGEASSGEEVRVVPPPPGQAIIHDRVPTDSSFENVNHEDAAQDELEYQDEQTPLPVKRPELTFTYQVAPIPLPPVDTSITTPPPMDAPHEHEEDVLGDLHEQPGNTSEFGEMRQPLGQMLGLGRGKKKNGSVLDYDFSGSPWNPRTPQQTQTQTLAGSLGAGSTFTGAGMVPPPAPTPEFFTQPEGAVPEPEAWESDDRGRPPTYHSRRNSAISLSGLAKSASEAGIGAKPVPAPTPPPTSTTPARVTTPAPASAPATTAPTATVPPVPESVVGSRRNSRLPSREASLEKLNNRAQTEVGTGTGTGAKGSRKGSREQSREPSVDPTSRKTVTELGTPAKGGKNGSKEALDTEASEAELAPEKAKKHGRASSVASNAATEPPASATKPTSTWGANPPNPPKKSTSVFGGLSGSIAGAAGGWASGGWGGAQTKTKKKESLFDFEFGSGDTGGNTGGNTGGDAGNEFNAFDDGWGDNTGAAGGDGNNGGAGQTAEDFFKQFESDDGAGAGNDEEQDDDIPDSELEPLPKGAAKLLEESMRTRKRIADLEKEVEAIGNTSLGKQGKRDLKRLRLSIERWYSLAYPTAPSIPDSTLDLTAVTGLSMASTLEDAVTKCLMANIDKLVLDGSKVQAKKWKPMRTAIINFSTRNGIDIHDDTKIIEYILPASSA